MRMRQRRDHHERSYVFARIALARDIEQLLTRGEGHFVVEVELIRAHARTCVDHGTHVVIPRGTRLEILPVGRPAEIGGIDVGRQPLLEAVQLVRAAEMHLAGKNRAISLGAQVVRERERLRRELGRVVISADLRRQLTREQRKRDGAQSGLAQ